MLDTWIWFITGIHDLYLPCFPLFRVDCRLELSCVHCKHYMKASKALGSYTGSPIMFCFTTCFLTIQTNSNDRIQTILLSILMGCNIYIQYDFNKHRQSCGIRVCITLPIKQRFILSVESQKGAINIQRCSGEKRNYIGCYIAVQYILQ